MNDIRIGRAMHDDVTHLPPSLIIDIDAAMAAGGRRIRRRAIATRTAVAALVVAVPVAAMAIVRLPQPNADQRTAVATASAAPSASAAGPTVPTAPARFDPLRTRLRLGWIPAGLPDHREDIGTLSQTLAYSTAQQGLGATVTVTICALGVRPYEVGATIERPGMKPTTSPGPAIGDQPSTWYGSGATLTWEWAPKARAAVSVRGFGTTAADRAAAARIAAALRTDVDEPVRMPLRMPAPPKPLRLVRTLVATYGGRVEGQLIFSDVDDELDPKTRIGRMLVVAVEPAGSGHHANTTVGGRPAYVDFEAGAGVVKLTNVGGLQASVYVYDPVTMTYVNRATAEQLVGRIQGITDPQQWTTDPIL